MGDMSTGLIQKYIGMFSEASDANAKNQMAAQKQDYDMFNKERSVFLKNLGDRIDNAEQDIKNDEDLWHKAAGGVDRDTIRTRINSKRKIHESLTATFGTLYPVDKQISDLEAKGHNVSEFRGMGSKVSQGQRGGNGSQGGFDRSTAPTRITPSPTQMPAERIHGQRTPERIPIGMSQMLSKDSISPSTTTQPREIPTQGVIQPAQQAQPQVQQQIQPQPIQPAQPTDPYAGKTTAQIKLIQYEQKRQDKLIEGTKQGDSSLAARREKAYIPNPDGTFTMGYTDEKSGDFTPFLRKGKPIILTGKQVLLSSGKRAESLINPYQVAFGKAAGRIGGNQQEEIENQIIMVHRSNRVIARALKQLDRGIYAGSLASTKLAFNKFLRGVGFNLTGSKIENTEVFVNVLKRDVIAILGSGDLGRGVAISDKDREFVEGIVAGNIGLDENSIRTLLNINKRVNDAKIIISNRRLDLLQTRYIADDPFAGSFKGTQKQILSKKETQAVDDMLKQWETESQQ